MNGDDVYDLHIWGCAAVALLCPVTGNTGIQRDKKTWEKKEKDRTSQDIYGLPVKIGGNIERK